VSEKRSSRCNVEVYPRAVNEPCLFKGRVKRLKTMPKEPKYPSRIQMTNHDILMIGAAPRELDEHSILNDIPKCLRLIRRLFLSQPIMLVDIYRLPGIADPNIPRSSRSQVSILGQHILRQLSFLLFVLILFPAVRNTANLSLVKREYSHAKRILRTPSSPLYHPTFVLQAQRPSLAPSQHIPT
jgi:hypothetical protein